MDDRIKHIIESGLMESYLLGECSPEQEQEIDALLENSEELQRYLSELEDGLWAMTETVAVEPPAELKDRIKASLGKTSSRENLERPSANSRALSWTVVALASALIIALLLFVSGWVRNMELSRDKQRVELLLLQHEDHMEDLNAMIDTMQAQLQLLMNENTRRYPISAQTNNGNLQLMAYWNTKLSSSLLKIVELPEIPEDQCLQMWADVDGKMISVGILANSTGLMPINYLDNAESLNVTVEKAGGAEHPTVANLIANVLI